MKSEEKNKARELRSQGIAIKKIAKQLNVASSSVSSWVRDIELTEEQIETLKQQNPIYNVQLRGASTRFEDALKIREQYQKEGMLKAQEGNLLHMAGCMLYWGEGEKNRNSVNFVNSDINMIKFFIKFLYEVYNIQKSELTCRINCYTNNNLSIEDIENYWISELNLDKNNFRKSIVNNLPKCSKQKKDKNKLLYGTISIRVQKSTWLAQNIFGAIQEYANFYNNYCLD